MSTIRLSDETKEKLKNEGKKGDSYEDIILKKLTKKGRTKIKEEFGYKCEKCGSKENLEIHHIKPKQTGLNNNINNLQLLCRECHIKIPISNRTNKDRKLITLNIIFTDKEFTKLKKFKEMSNKNWHDFILMIIKGEE